MISKKLIYYFLRHNKIYSLRYLMKDDCIRIFESLSAKGIIHIFKGVKNLMQPVCTINLQEELVNTFEYLFVHKDIKYIIKLFLFNQIIRD